MITFKKFFGEYVRNREITNAKSKSNLTNYVHFPIMFGKQPYLSNLLEFQPTRLKMLARTNTLSINSVLHRMKLHTTSVCEMCSQWLRRRFIPFHVRLPGIHTNTYQLPQFNYRTISWSCFLRVVAL